MALIDSRGLISDGSNSLTISGNVSVTSNLAVNGSLAVTSTITNLNLAIPNWWISFASGSNCKRWSNGGSQLSVGYNGTTLIAEGPFANSYTNFSTASPSGFQGGAHDIRNNVHFITRGRVY
jgi:hypothetical protein